MSNVLFMAGKVLIDRLTDAGASTGYIDPSEVGSLKIEETADIKTLKSKGRDTYGQTIATVSLKNPAKITLTLNEVDPAALAVALLGDEAALSEASGTVTDVAPTEITLIPGKWVPLPHRNITPHVDVTSPIVLATDADTPVSIPLTDVEINERLGLIKYIGTSLTEATAITATYAYGAVSGTRISGSTQPTVKMRILLDGKNLVSGEDVRVMVDEATLTPATPIDFAAEDWGTVELTGELTTLTGKTAPYVVDIIS